MLIRPWRLAFHGYGRSTRTEYLLFMIQLAMIWVAAVVFIIRFTAPADGDAPMPETDQLIGWAVILFLGLLLMVPAAFATIRRIHDFDQSGWLVVMLLAGWLALVIFGFIPGTVGPNRHGPDPRGRGGQVGHIFS